MEKLHNLIKGHKEFKELHFKNFEVDFDNLVKNGQSPEVLFIGCCDSRVVPDLITGSKPGDLFILRNVGNFVPPFKGDNDFHGTAAAIEYAVSILNIKHIIVCGHTYCGACEALFKEMKDDDESVHIKKWLELGKKSKDFVIKNFAHLPKESMLRTTEQISIIFQLENLMTYPGVKRRVEEGSLTVHGWYYKLEDGSIEYYDTEELEFRNLGSNKYKQ